MTYYIFEVNTDQRYGVRKLIKTQSKKTALKYLEQETTFANPELATNDLPGYYQNWHHKIYQVYEYHGRLPIKDIRKEYERREKHYRHSTYRNSVSLESEIATFLHTHGRQVSYSSVAS